MLEFGIAAKLDVAVINLSTAYAPVKEFLVALILQRFANGKCKPQNLLMLRKGLYHSQGKACFLWAEGKICGLMYKRGEEMRW